MVSKNNNPDWLPSGWKVQIKVKNDRKYKCYVHPRSCQKFYSKPEVLRFLKDDTITGDKSQAITLPATESPGKQETQIVVANGSHQWLPTGWTMEIKTRKSGARKGTEYKCYTDTSGTNKFYSKPEVMRYLRSVEGNKGSAGASGEKERRSTRHSSDNRSDDQPTTEKSKVEPYVLAQTHVSSGEKERSVDQQMTENSKVKLNVSAPKHPSSEGKEVLVENTVDKDLPSGWIKEIRNRVRGKKVVRKDPLYCHPASGLVFRSKREVRCYLETGEISRHAYRRMGGRAHGEESAVKKETAPSLVRSDKSTIHETKKEHSCQGDLTLLPGAKVRRITRSSSKFEVTSSGKSSPVQRSTSHGAKKEHACQGDSSLVPRASVRRITRSSSNFQATSSGESIPVQRSLLPETVNKRQEKLPSLSLTKIESTTDNVRSVTEIVSQMIVHDDCHQINVSVIQTKQPSVSSTDMLKLENPDAVTMQCCSNGKAPTNKRKMKDQIPNSGSSHSSKRLAGIDAKVVFHSIPIEHAVRSASSKSRRTKPCTSLGTTSNNLKQNPMSPDVHMLSVPPVHEVMHRTLDINTQPVLATEEQRGISNSSMQRVHVELEEHSPPGFSKSSVNEAAQPSNTVQLSEGSRGRVLESNIGEKQLSRGHPNLEGQPDELAGGNKMEQIPISQPIQVDRPASLAIDSEPSASKFGSPSQSRIVKLPIDHLILGGVDTLTESKIEPSNTGRTTPEDNHASTGRDTEQPAPDFSFPSPMWSDPCLEFAYKTLTGAISLDDNLAIEDYIQHQLRTSKPSKDFQSLPDVDAPSFFQNDETKPVSPRPEGVRFPNGNGLRTPKTIR